MNKEKKLIPDLRFPEFSNEEGWEEKELNEIAERIQEKVGDQKLITVSISAGKGFVSQAEKFSRNISGKQYKNYIFLKEGEFAFNKGNSKKFPQGCIYKLKEFKKAAAPNAFICFRFKADVVADFYQGYFDRNYHGRQLQRYITSGARMDGLLNVSPTDFFSIILPTPKNIKEQQKIASCLSSLDELISAHNDKLQALKDHKKGLMQNLFPPANGSHYGLDPQSPRIPPYRFPDFEGDGEWEEKSVDKLMKIISGKGFKASEYSNNGVRLLQIENVGYGRIKWSKKPISLPDDYIKDYPELILAEGDIVLALNRPVTNNELKIARLTKYDEPSILYQRVGKIELLFTSFDKGFIFQICSLFIKKFVMRNSIGSDQPFISLKELYAQKIRIPTFKEQQKIASCLSALDALITAEAEKIEQLQLHKKGLMQALFPSANGGHSGSAPQTQRASLRT